MAREISPTNNLRPRLYYPLLASTQQLVKQLHRCSMAGTRSPASEDGENNERPPKRPRVDTEAHSIATVEESSKKREESPVSDDDHVEDTTRAVQGSDLYLDTVRPYTSLSLRWLRRYDCCVATRSIVPS